MSRIDANEGAHGNELDPALSTLPDDALAADDEADAEEPAFFEDPKRLAQTGLVVFLLVVGIYILLPKILEDQDASSALADAKLIWILVAVAFAFAMFGAYVALFKGVVGDRGRRDPDLPADGARPRRPRAALLGGDRGEVLGPVDAGAGYRALHGVDRRPRGARLRPRAVPGGARDHRRDRLLGRSD